MRVAGDQLESTAMATVASSELSRAPQEAQVEAPVALL
jgi:hypothetical protein